VKKILLTLMLAVMSSSAMANWVEVGKEVGSRMIFYADPTTIKKHGNTVKMWVLYDYKETQKKGNSKPFRSYKDYFEYDCKEDHGRSRYVSFHSENMGGGVSIESRNYISKWEPLSPHSIGLTLLEFACGK